MDKLIKYTVIISEFKTNYSIINSYFNRSYKRLYYYKQFCLKNNIIFKSIPDYIPTRWLSIYECMKFLYVNWDFIKQFF